MVRFALPILRFFCLSATHEGELLRASVPLGVRVCLCLWERMQFSGKVKVRVPDQYSGRLAPFPLCFLPLCRASSVCALASGRGAREGGGMRLAAPQRENRTRTRAYRSNSDKAPERRSRSPKTSPQAAYAPLCRCARVGGRGVTAHVRACVSVVLVSLRRYLLCVSLCYSF